MTRIPESPFYSCDSSDSWCPTPSMLGADQGTGGARLWDIRDLITELRIGPAIVLSDGRVQLQLSGVSGQCVRVQRSANLVDWEDWRTVTLNGDGCELIDDPAAASQRFYRAVQDDSIAAESTANP